MSKKGSKKNEIKDQVKGFSNEELEREYLVSKHKKDRLDDEYGNDYEKSGSTNHMLWSIYYNAILEERESRNK